MRSYSAPAFNFDPVNIKGDKCSFCGYKNQVDAVHCVLCKRPLSADLQAAPEKPGSPLNAGKAAFEIAFSQKMPEFSNNVKKSRPTDAFKMTDIRKAAGIRNVPDLCKADDTPGTPDMNQSMAKAKYAVPKFDNKNDNKKICLACKRLNDEKSIFCSFCHGELSQSSSAVYSGTEQKWSTLGFLTALISLGIAFSAGIALSRFL
jgi:hypothetical protein